MVLREAKLIDPSVKLTSRSPCNHDNVFLGHEVERLCMLHDFGCSSFPGLSKSAVGDPAFGCIMNAIGRA